MVDGDLWTMCQCSTGAVLWMLKVFNNSTKPFLASYPSGQIVWRDLHVAKDRSHWSQSDELFQTAASPSLRILKCQRLDQVCGHRSSYSMRWRQHRCGGHISSHWWHGAVRSSRCEAPATSSWIRHPFRRCHNRNGKPSRTCWSWEWSCQPWQPPLREWMFCDE